MRSHRLEILISLGLVAMTILSFGRVLGSDFEFLNFDDYDYVKNNPEVQSGLSAHGFQWTMTTTKAFNWHPLTWLSLQLDARIYGLDPRGFHLTNLLLHTANSVLWFLLLLRLTGAVWRSAAVAAFFAVHPLHVESVAWIAERKDVLSTLFWILTIWAYHSYVGRPGWARYGLVVLAYALGLLSKPMLVTLPCVLLLLDYWPLNRWGKGEGERGRAEAVDSASLPPSPSPLPPWFVLLEKGPLFLLAAFSCVKTVQAQERLTKTLEQFPFSVRLMNVMMAYVSYLEKMFWPSGLGAYYPHPGDELSPGLALAASLLLAVITIVVVANPRRRPFLFVGWFWYLGTLVPVIGLVQVGLQFMADRYTYVPMIGVGIMLAWGLPELLARWCNPRIVLVPVIGALLAACMAATWFQVGYWKNSVALWERTLAVTPAHPLLHLYLGKTYQEQNRTEEAMVQFAAVVAVKPNSPEAHTHLGVYFQGQGKLDQAVDHFAAAVRSNPEVAELHEYLGRALVQRGNYVQAFEQFQAALQLEPSNSRYWHNLARLSWSLATQQDPQRRNGYLALQYARLICQATQDQQPEYLDILAASLAEVGQFNEAAQTAKKALALAQATQRQNLTGPIEARIRLYETGKPFREEPKAVSP